jgi:hypothetical protein
MKKNLKTQMPKLRVSKETLLPLESRQMREVAGGSATVFIKFIGGALNTQVVHIE